MRMTRANCLHSEETNTRTEWAVMLVAGLFNNMMYTKGHFLKICTWVRSCIVRELQTRAF